MPFFLPDDPYFANFDICYNGSYTDVKICLESISLFEFLKMPIQCSPLHQSQLFPLGSGDKRMRVLGRELECSELALAQLLPGLGLEMHF